jgi:hypothetical protein
MNPPGMSRPCIARAIYPLLGVRGYVRTYKEHECRLGPEVAMLFSFPEDARWNEARNAVELGIEKIGEYAEVRFGIPRRASQRPPRRSRET